MPSVFLTIPGRVLNYISLERVSLAYAIFNCIFTGLAVLATIAWVLLGLIVGGYDGPQYFGQPSYIIASVGVGAIVFSIVAFIFSIILARGLVQKSPALLKAYFLYLLVVTLLCVVAGVCLFVKSNRESDHEQPIDNVAAALILSSMFHACVLVMIWKLS